MALNLSVELVAIDTPDPHALAHFYSRLLDVPVTRNGDDWVEIGTGEIKVAFQLAPDHRPPQWPYPDHPQQMHMDIDIAGKSHLPEAAAHALALGAAALTDPKSDDNGGFQVFADPSGHPFCLVWRD